MARIYFDQAGTVKPAATRKTPVVATYHITLGGRRLAVRASHHDFLHMLPGIMRAGGNANVKALA